jgi:hypothetical protein
MESLVNEFNEALVGTSLPQPGRSEIAVYSSMKCIELIMERDARTYQEALEFFEHNIVSSWNGKLTPVFIADITLPETVKDITGTKESS